MRKIRLTKQEKREMYKTKLEIALKGEGLYVFRNNSGGDLRLPKPSHEGWRSIRPGAEFQGDSYFMSLVKTNEARLVRTIEAPGKKETETMEDKLIVDQPDRVTNEGTVENVVTPKKKNTQLNEDGTPQEDQDDILLIEDPMDGVEIITD